MNPLYWLLLFIPITAVLEYVFHAGPVLLFVTSGLTLLPLSALLCRSTERVADRVGQGLGGMLNATFGNAPELIIGIMALREGMYDVLKASITGSIIGNILLVYGTSAVVAGLRHSVLYFNQSAAGVSATMLALGIMALSLPAVFQFAVPQVPHAIDLRISMFISIALIVTYLCSLVFSLKTHRHLYTGASEAEPEEEAAGGPPVWKSVLIMGVTTVFVAWMSEILVGAVDGTASSLGINRMFMGVFFVGVLGNAADHTATVYLAMRKKMDAAINITSGASIQIALFVAPSLVLLSHFIGPRPMDLHFSPLELTAIGMGVGGIVLTTNDGNISWIEGVQLLAIYAMLGVTFFFLPGTV